MVCGVQYVGSVVGSESGCLELGKWEPVKPRLQQARQACGWEGWRYTGKHTHTTRVRVNEERDKRRSR